MLPARSDHATTGHRRCYERPTALLRAVVGEATNCGLPHAIDGATRPTTVLWAADGGATSGGGCVTSVVGDGVSRRGLPPDRPTGRWYELKARSSVEQFFSMVVGSCREANEKSGQTVKVMRTRVNHCMRRGRGFQSLENAQHRP